MQVDRDDRGKRQGWAPRDYEARHRDVKVH